MILLQILRFICVHDILLSDIYFFRTSAYVPSLCPSLYAYFKYKESQASLPDSKLQGYPISGHCKSKHKSINYDYNTTEQLGLRQKALVQKEKLSFPSMYVLLKFIIVLHSTYFFNL